MAVKRPERPVVCLLGDGETLMGAGSLWSFAGLRPANLLVAILDDGHYTITGGQELGAPTAFAEVAAALGLASAVAETAEEIGAQVRSLPRPGLLVMRYTDRVWPGPSPFVDPARVRLRFEAAAS